MRGDAASVMHAGTASAHKVMKSERPLIGGRSLVSSDQVDLMYRTDLQPSAPSTLDYKTALKEEP
jgi:hypothetical protein